MSIEYGSITNVRSLNNGGAAFMSWKSNFQFYSWHDTKSIKSLRQKMSIRPTSNDVLHGRGGNQWRNKGNERLRNLALRRAREYAAATKKEKAVISREVLRQIKEAGGRFLRKIDYKADIWEEVSDETAREKVCQVFRDHVSSIRDTNTQRSDNSSSSEDSEAEDEEDDSGADGFCNIRGGGEWEAVPGLCQVKDEADNAFLSDMLATNDLLMPDLITSSPGLRQVKDEANNVFLSDVLATNDIPMPDLIKVKEEADNAFLSDALATNDLPMPDLITSSVVSPAAREHMEFPRDNFDVDAVAGYCNDFDLFDGELLRSSAYDEIFVTSSRNNVVQL